MVFVSSEVAGRIFCKVFRSVRYAYAFAPDDAITLTAFVELE